MNVPVLPVTQGRVLRRVVAGSFELTETRYAGGTLVPLHVHDRPSIAVALSGSFIETLGSRTIECHPFDAIAKSAAEAHRDLYGRDGARCLLIEADSRAAEEIRLFRTISFVPAARARLHMERICRELVAQDDVAPLALEGAILDLVCSIARAGAERADVRVGLATDFIRARWRTKLTLAEIASAAGVSVTTLTRAFRAELRCSPARYLRRVRLDHAAAALRDGTRSISEIAVECGFYDHAHFATAFRQHTGATPAAYRAAFSRRTTIGFSTN